MLIPINSDAPLYHWPIATVGIVVFTTAFSIFMWSVSPETFDEWILVYGNGIHPLQWFTSICMHGDFGHLLGNMIFLLPFGLLVEGKIGWWRFLLLYLAIGVGESAFEQIVMLGMSSAPGSLGASSALFGLVVVTMLWAPKNDMTCLFIWLPYVRTLDIPITYLAMFYVGWEGLMLLLDGFAIRTAALHLMGALMGGVLGIAFLKLKWVDCEGWDLLSVMSGNDAGAVRTREMIGGAEQDKVQEVNQTMELKREAQRQAALEQFLTLLKSGNAVAANTFYLKASETYGTLELSAAQFMHLGKGLLDAKQYDDCIAAWLEYLKLESSAPIKLRLKLAQLLVDHTARPATALEVLAGIPADPLPDNLEPIRVQLTTKANDQLEDAELELE